MVGLSDEMGFYLGFAVGGNMKGWGFNFIGVELRIFLFEENWRMKIRCLFIFKSIWFIVFWIVDDG